MSNDEERQTDYWRENFIWDDAALHALMRRVGDRIPMGVSFRDWIYVQATQEFIDYPYEYDKEEYEERYNICVHVCSLIKKGYEHYKKYWGDIDQARTFNFIWHFEDQIFKMKNILTNWNPPEYEEE